MEPEKKNFEALASHSHKNGYSWVALYNCAAGQENGTQTLNINPLNHGGNSLIPFESYFSGQERHSAAEIQARYTDVELFEQVSVRTLDDMVQEQNVSTIAIVKIDVEGFEEEVLKGAQNMIAQRVAKHFICEVNNDARRSEVFQLFVGNGYTPYRISFMGLPEVISAEINIQRLHGNVLFSLITTDDKKEL